MELPTWRNSIADYPFDSHFAEVDGMQMHYLDEGEGRPLLMVHGNPTWSFYYRNLVKGFANQYRCIAVDHIGCGLSEKSADAEYTLDRRIDQLSNLVSQLDLNDITLLVHDWGGAIGLGAALKDLNRYHSFVIFNTGAFPPPFFPWRIRVCRTPGLGRVALQGFNLFAKAAIHQATEQRGGLPADVRDGLLAPYDNWANRRAIYEFVRDIPTHSQQPAWQTLKRIETGLSELKEHPVKLIWGMKDWCFRPECLRKFQELLPHAEVCELADAGHYVIEDQTTRVIDEVRSFLAE